MFTDSVMSWIEKSELLFFLGGSEALLKVQTYMFGNCGQFNSPHRTDPIVVRLPLKYSDQI